MEGNATIHYSCAPKSSGATSIVISSLALPFHILLMKILIADFGLSLPRHLIMLSLTVSDALQIFGLASLSSLAMVLQLTTESLVCAIVRDISVFISSLTIIVSSLVLITFAIERMIISIHFLKYHKLFRRSRIKKLLSSYWLVGVIVAAIATVTNDAQKTETSLNESISFRIISTLIILPSALIITAIYFRIFLFSRERKIRIIPNPVSSNFISTNTFKKKQLRIAVVTGIVCAAYVGCMAPIAITYFLELTGLINNHPYEKTLIINIVMVNNLADPFIYGFGVAQTRHIFIRMVKSICPI